MTNLHPTIHGIKKQRTYVMIKPDGVIRGLTGEILSRIERSGMKIVALKMVNATKEQIVEHYPVNDQTWVNRLGDKGLNTFTDLKLDAKEFLGTDNNSEIGQKVVSSLISYMTSGPVVCMVLEGIQAVDMMRKIIGHTLPFKADMGTIRGDFSVDSPAIANVENRSIHNLIHASETVEEAENEMKIWFDTGELVSYTKSGEDVMYSKTY